MRTILLLGLIALLLALDWAALHDILKGEPDPYMEYGMILLSVAMFGLVIFIKLRRRGKGTNIS